MTAAGYDPRQAICVVGSETPMGYLTTREKESKRDAWRFGLLTRAEQRKEAKEEEARTEKKKG